MDLERGVAVEGVGSLLYLTAVRATFCWNVCCVNTAH